MPPCRLRGAKSSAPGLIPSFTARARHVGACRVSRVRMRTGKDADTDESTGVGGYGKPPVVVHVAAKEALNAVIAAQGFSYDDADAIVSLGAALVRKSEGQPWSRLKEHSVLEQDSWLKVEILQRHIY